MIHLSHNHINRTLCGLDSLKVKTMRVIDYLAPADNKPEGTGQGCVQAMRAPRTSPDRESSLMGPLSFNFDGVRYGCGHPVPTAFAVHGIISPACVRMTCPDCHVKRLERQNSTLTL